MNKISIIVIFILLTTSLVAQDKLMNIEKNGQSIPVLISNGDTTIIFGLPTITVTAPHKFTSYMDELYYMKYKRYAISVFPYAVKAIKVFRAMNKDTENMNKSDKKKYIKKLQKELEAEFEKPLTNLTKTQGMILVKMIEKELDTPMYSLIKDLKGSWSAFYWNTSGYFYGYHLKDGYNRGVDPILDLVLDDFDIDYTIRQENFIKPVQ
ncbi:MAG TPA: DUF4294 domain-containing protein [Saprospiraceae bacterium]|nr:DUF4294 domain-containing protein [Saprospiraceae bacterium]